MILRAKNNFDVKTGFNQDVVQLNYGFRATWNVCLFGKYNDKLHGI